MSPRHNWPKEKPQHPKARENATVTHRQTDAIQLDIRNAPAQALPELQAELVAALDAERDR